MNEVTIKTRDLIVASILVLGAMVAYALLLPKTNHSASAAVGAPVASGPVCAAPAVTNSVPDALGNTVPVVAEETPSQSTTKEVTKTTTTSHTHNEYGLANVNDITLKDTVDVTTGDILSNNLNNNDVKVSVDDTLNPVTNVLGGVLNVL
jgi:hypothetical protein